jgi:hypothetical protein
MARNVRYGVPHPHLPHGKQPSHRVVPARVDAATPTVVDAGIVTLAATAGFGAPASVATSSTATLATTAGLSAAGSNVDVAAATMLATAGLSTAALVTQPGAATLSTTANLTAAATATTSAAATLATTANLTTSSASVSTGSATLATTANLTTASSVSAVASVTLPVTASLSAAAVLTRFGPANLATAANLSAAGSALTSSSALLSTTASLTTAALVAVQGLTTLGVTASLTSAADLTRTAAASVGVSAALAASGAGTVLGATALATTASLTTAAVPVALASSVLATTASLTASGAVAGAVSALLATTASLTASALLQQLATAQVATTAGLSAARTGTTFGTLALSTTANLTTSATNGKTGTVVVNVTASLTSTGDQALTAAATIATTASLGTSVTGGLFGSVLLPVTASLSPVGIASIYAATVLAVRGQSLFFSIKRGDTSPALELQILDGEAPVQGLATASEVRLLLRANSSVAPLVSAPMAVQNQTLKQGWVSRAWQTGETDVAGSYRGEVQVTWGDGSKTTFPAAGYFTVQVVPTSAERRHTDGGSVFDVGHEARSDHLPQRSHRSLEAGSWVARNTSASSTPSPTGRGKSSGRRRRTGDAEHGRRFAVAAVQRADPRRPGHHAHGRRDRPDRDVRQRWQRVHPHRAVVIVVRLEQRPRRAEPWCQRTDRRPRRHSPRRHRTRRLALRRADARVHLEHRRPDHRSPSQQSRRVSRHRRDDRCLLRPDRQAREQHEPWEFHVEDYGAVGDGTTDDTAAIKATIAAAVTYAQANNQFAEVLFRPVRYKIAGALDNTKSGRAQIPLPIIATTAQKVYLSLRCPGGGTNAPPMWTQAGGTQTGGAGAVLVSTLTGLTFDATHGRASVIGGPTNEHGYGTNNGVTSLFTNLFVSVEGITVMAPLKPTITAFDFYGCAGMDMVSGFASVNDTYANLSSQSNRPDNSTSGAAGLVTPANMNNDEAHIGNFAAYGYGWGMIAGSHVSAQTLKFIYCANGMRVQASGYDPHGIAVNYMSVEACDWGITQATDPSYFYALNIGLLDCESLGYYNGLGAAGGHIYDNGNALTGLVNLTDVVNSFTFVGGTLQPGVVVTGAKNLEIITPTARGARVAPSVPATTSAFTNPFWRHCAVTVAGGTVTGIAVDGQTLGVTSGTVIVPSGKTITLTYSSAPTWKWTAL